MFQYFRKTVATSGFLMVLLFLCGCSMQASQFANEKPVFKPEEFFSEPRTGYGYFFDRFGNVISRFRLDFRGRREGDTLHLNEVMYASTGDVDSHTYQFKKVNENLYEVTGPDVVGKGQLEAYGNTLRGRYRVKQLFAGECWTLNFDDWFFLQHNGKVLNRGYVRKFGVNGGHVQMRIEEKKKALHRRAFIAFFRSLVQYLHRVQPGSQHRQQLLGDYRLREVIGGACLDTLLSVSFHRLRSYRDDR
jgi:hypothetical protein